MDPSTRIPVWLHVVRISVLTAAVVAVAWVVLSAQRRAMQARAAAQAAERASAAEPLPTAPEFELPVPEEDQEIIRAEIDLPDVAHPQIAPPSASRVFVPVALEDAAASELPPFTLESPPEPQLRLPEFRLESPMDPYIGSSKSMVITPGMVRPGQSNPRHGKP